MSEVPLYWDLLGGAQGLGGERVEARGGRGPPGAREHEGRPRLARRGPVEPAGYG